MRSSPKSPREKSIAQREVFFNAHHSPVGAFASFTLGCPGAKGGFGIELPRPANENVYIGLEAEDGSFYEALPFYGNDEDEARRYDVSASREEAESVIRPFPRSSIRRGFSMGEDSWMAGDLECAVYSPVKSVPDPDRATVDELREALVPAVFVELKVDNSRCRRARKVFFGYQGADSRAGMRRWSDIPGESIVGVGQGLQTAVVSDAAEMEACLGFSMEKCLRPLHSTHSAFGLGTVGALVAIVPAGQSRTYRLALCFHHAGIVTAGMPCSYAYARYFPTMESVGVYALHSWKRQRAMALREDRRIAARRLNEAQQFMLAHAARSYCGSTQFLEVRGRPFWVVNEGEYRMMNTFDLTVDHLFFELARNPWVVRNQLEWFSRRFSYRDHVRLPGDPCLYPGGVSFTHDMGVANVVSRRRFSAYEMSGVDGCFGYMTHEQLVNWVLCAVSYAVATGDKEWSARQAGMFRACLESLVHRDHPDPASRDGVMSADSSRCEGAAEITTYDSLDASLGQARNNLYLAVKTWAAYLGLRRILASSDPDLAGLAGRQAELCAETIVTEKQADGHIPAILKEGSRSRIIPAIEGLVFPHLWGMRSALSERGEFGRLIRALKTHLEAVLRPGVCRFPDGGWKLSSTNENSWLSKIYLCQFVAREILGFAGDAKADEAHRGWLLHAESVYYAWSDQMISGKARGSKYYPRGVTAWLWISETASRLPKRKT